MAESALKKVTVYLPTGQEITVPGERANCMAFGNGVTVVEERFEDGSYRRFVGLPHVMTFDAPPLIETATTIVGVTS